MASMMPGLVTMGSKTPFKSYDDAASHYFEFALPWLRKDIKLSKKDKLSPEKLQEYKKQLTEFKKMLEKEQAKQKTQDKGKKTVNGRSIN